MQPIIDHQSSYRETLFSPLTLIGRVLKRQATTLSQCGNGAIAIIEATHLFEGLTRLIKAVALRCWRGSQLTSPIYKPFSLTDLTHLPFDTPTIFTTAQALMLKINTKTHESTLPAYADSVFQHVVLQMDESFIVTRRKKETPPPLNGSTVRLAPLRGPSDAQSDEGLKVRTFCLELLSNLEDLQMTKQNSLTLEPLPGNTRDDLIRIEEVKGVVRYFLELAALQKKAGFSDYIHLLNILTEGAEPLFLLFKRHIELIELQKKLPKKANHRVSHWDKIRIMVRAGLCEKTLVETADCAKQMGLHPIPTLPRTQAIVNLYSTLDAINLLESKHREAGRWLMHHVRVITFRELCQSIKKSCEELRETILEWDDYSLLSIKGKSQEWVADIAYRYLPKMPKEIHSMDHRSAGVYLYKYLTASHTKNFILFDDGAYSGSQLTGYLEDLLLGLKEKGSLIEKKNLYFIFGHFPHDIYLQINSKLFEEYNVNIRVISNLLTENCQALMEKEGLTDAMKTQIKDLANPDKPQIVNQWKRPDYMSTALFISEGYLGCFSRFGIYGELNAGDFVDLRVEFLNGIGPIANIIPPYKNE